jgi:hypothetical protein
MNGIRKKVKLFILYFENFYGSGISKPVVAEDYFSLAWHTNIQMQ